MTLTEPAADVAIFSACSDLRLPSVREQASIAADLARREHRTHRVFLADLLACEIDDRNARRAQRRLHDARFPRFKTIGAFDTSANAGVSAQQIAHLAAGEWIDAGEPVVFLGDSGTGKTHLLIAIGAAACEAGKRVRYTTMAALACELTEAQSDHHLAKTIGRYSRYDLVCLDELGYVHLDAKGAELIFQVITERDERASVAVATNLPFSEWPKVFTDTRLCAAIVDRLTHNGHIIETGTESYRLLSTKTQNKRR
jgi:DNA replication protein DnaC